MNIPPVSELLNLSGKTAVITGGGHHIGRGIALRFAGAGADVAVHYHTSAAPAQAVVDEIRSLGRRALAVQADLTRADEVERLMDAVCQTLGGVDRLVNNAGIYPTRALVEISPEEWDEMLNANLRSAFLCTQAAAKRMIAAGTGGAIVNITSISAHNAVPLHAHYCASKAGLEAFTQVSAAELGKHGIRVNAVAPGLIWREGIEQGWPEGVARWLQAAPLQRLGCPEDVADACLFLASDAARWITGASLRVDGGVLTHQAF